MKNTNTVLIQKDNLCIEQCSCCDNIHLMYQSLLLKFTPESFADFEAALSKLDFENRAITFGDGTDKMLINTPQKEIQLCFTKKEFELLRQSLKEALLMLEVSHILYG
ncbi:MAG: hypothetical protein GWN00_03980 [Aliifodinibius sp.]|nr:hypothetical protein [Fodinibius sp.]NIV10354.1 hypothetical protein [Fodinibius sp.]NIY23993.1 hypothetical protein [Fodinibius sp.]